MDTADNAGQPIRVEALGVFKKYMKSSGNNLTYYRVVPLGSDADRNITCGAANVSLVDMVEYVASDGLLAGVKVVNSSKLAGYPVNVAVNGTTVQPVQQLSLPSVIYYSKRRDIYETNAALLSTTLTGECSRVTTTTSPPFQQFISYNGHGQCY